MAIDYSETSEGSVWIYADHQDSAGNAATRSSVTVIKDAVLPVVNVGADVVANNSTLINASTSDLSSITHAWTKVSGPGAINFTQATAQDTSVVAGSNGAYVLRLTATDAAGNIAYDELNFTWDSQAPVVLIDTPVSGSHINAAQAASLTVSGTCSEDGRNVAISGSKTASTSCTSGAWSVAIDYSCLLYTSDAADE